MTGGPQWQVPVQENCPGAATASAASSGAYTSYVTASGTAAPGQQLDDVELTRLLNADHDRLLDILGAISPVAVDWVTQNSRVPQTISRRNDVVTGTQSTAF